MSKKFIGSLLTRIRELQTSITAWVSYNQAYSSFAYLGKNVIWPTHIEWVGPERIYINDNCILKRNVKFQTNGSDDERIFLASKVIVSENVLLSTQKGNIEIGENATLGENVRIIANEGSVNIGKNVTIGRGTEIIADSGDITLGDGVHIDPICWLRGNGVRGGEGNTSKGLIELGNQSYIGFGTVLEANGGYIRTESEVKIDYQNIIGGRGGVHFESRAHLRHSNYIDAFKEEIRFGEHITVGQKCIIAGRGAIKIGAKSLIGGLTFIVSENHKADRFDVPYRYQGHDYEGIVLEENVWIGGQTLIIDGVTIGTGTLVGGGAVVVNDLDPWSFAVGVPASRIRDIREK